MESSIAVCGFGTGLADGAGIGKELGRNSRVCRPRNFGVGGAGADYISGDGVFELVAVEAFLVGVWAAWFGWYGFTV